MTPEQKEAVIAALVKALETTEKEIALLKTCVAPPAQDCALEPLTKSEMIAETNHAIARLVETQQRNKKLKQALRNSRNEDFGLCESCREPIAYERLLLMPESGCCVMCLREGACRTDPSPSAPVF